MRCEIPILSRCCFCLPLRPGLIAWTYFKMVANLILIMVVSGFINSFIYQEGSSPLSLYVAFALLSLDEIQSFIFLVAAHKKSSKLMQKCLYLKMFLFLVSNLSIFVLIVKDLIESRQKSEGVFCINILVLNCVIKIYLIVLTRSEVLKLNSNTSTNGAKDAENSYCYMKASLNGNNLKKDHQIMLQHATILEEPVYCYAYGMVSNKCSERPVLPLPSERPYELM